MATAQRIEAANLDRAAANRCARLRWQRARRADWDRYSPIGDLFLRVPRRAVFLFFSNRLGCGGSLLLSVAVTLLLLVLIGAIRI